MVKHNPLRRGRRCAGRHLSFAGIGLLVLMVTMAGLALWDRREEGGGYIDGLARIVSFHPLRDFPLVVTVSAAEEAVLANWGRQSLFIALGMVCAAIGFALLFRALVARIGATAQSNVASKMTPNVKTATGTLIVSSSIRGISGAIQAMVRPMK